jgi:hypothetical protein
MSLSVAFKNHTKLYIHHRRHSVKPRPNRPFEPIPTEHLLLDLPSQFRCFLADVYQYLLRLLSITTKQRAEALKRFHIFCWPGTRQNKEVEYALREAVEDGEGGGSVVEADGRGELGRVCLCRIASEDGKVRHGIGTH